MDIRDMDLIRVLQDEGIYTTPSPFKTVAELMDWGLEEVLSRVQGLRDAGIIRRFGAALTPRNAGFKSNSMVAWDASEAQEISAGELMAAHPRVSHCYIRPRFEGFQYSLYTMIHANSPGDLRRIIDELSLQSGIKSYRALNSLKEFKKSSPVYFPAGKTGDNSGIDRNKKPKTKTVMREVHSEKVSV